MGETIFIQVIYSPAGNGMVVFKSSTGGEAFITLNSILHYAHYDTDPRLPLLFSRVGYNRFFVRVDSKVPPAIWNTLCKALYDGRFECENGIIYVDEEVKE